MQLDPTRWLVSLAGFIYDWIITREWTRILLAMIPVFLLCTVASLVWWGRNLDKRDLAAWYMELGDNEIADWESSWAGTASDDDVEKNSTGDEGTADNPDGEVPKSDEEKDASPNSAEKQGLSRFADMLFRRVQLLAPSDRSQFVIGASLAQRGALAQGKSMLSKIAPDDSRGYAPAHAFLAMISFDEFQKQPPTREEFEVLKHHISEAKRWDRVPQLVLKQGSRLFLQSGDSTESIQLLAKAAENEPALNLPLAKLAKSMENQRILEQSFPKAEAYFKERIAENPKDDSARVSLADLYASTDLDLAEQILKDGEKIERTQLIARGLSEVYRLRYAASMTKKDGVASANVQLLELAMRYDPTNPLVAEEIARLARIQGPTATEEMVERLQYFLAEGKATAATHSLLSEAYLLKNDFRKALPHLEQVVTRLPNASQSLNNIAFVTMELYPDKLEEALQYASRAIASAAATRSPNPDFFDTYGTILARLARSKEAITAFETAIEMNPRRIDFHERVAVEYRKLGNEAMAKNHDVVVERLKEMEQQARAEAAATKGAGTAESNSTDGETSDGEGTNLPPAEETQPVAEQEISKDDNSAKIDLPKRNE